jgi:hypothetical protein
MIGLCSGQNEIFDGLLLLVVIFCHHQSHEFTLLKNPNGTVVVFVPVNSFENV